MDQLAAPIDALRIAGVSEEEWALRVDLAATYRLAAHYGWDDLIFTHISLRLPGDHDHFLLNPYGVTFEEITASSLVKVDIDGEIVGPVQDEVNPAGFTIHSAIHMARDDADCVIHLHTDDGVAVSCQAEGLRPLSQHAALLGDEIAYHDYEGIALDHAERARLIRDIGEKHVLILRNHGTLTVGKTCAQAFMRMYYLERACSIQIRALSGGVDLCQMADDVVIKAASQGKRAFAERFGPRAWPALTRKLDRIDQTYKS